MLYIIPWFSRYGDDNKRNSRSICKCWDLWPQPWHDKYQAMTGVRSRIHHRSSSDKWSVIQHLLWVWTSFGDEYDYEHLSLLDICHAMAVVTGPSTWKLDGPVYQSSRHLLIYCTTPIFFQKVIMRSTHPKYHPVSKCTCTC
jgi:hypothetical protein